jgi:hypothetical protein
LFAGGFRPDFGSWLPRPDAFDDPVVDGLHFVGLTALSI